MEAFGLALPFAFSLAFGDFGLAAPEGAPAAAGWLALSEAIAAAFCAAAACHAARSRRSREREEVQRRSRDGIVELRAERSHEEDFLRV